MSANYGKKICKHHRAVALSGNGGLRSCLLVSVLSFRNFPALSGVLFRVASYRSHIDRAQQEYIIMRFFKTLFARREENLPEISWHQDTPLLKFNEGDVWTIGDSYKHTITFGATGSGKTTGALATLFRQFLRAGYGGLVLCAKPSEKEDWIRYCKQTNREDSLVIVTADNGMPYRFNFLDYENRRQGRGAGSTTNIIGLFASIMDIIENNTKESQSEDFWDRTALQMVGFAVIILALCNRPLSLKDIKDFIQSAPRSRDEKYMTRWQETSFAARCINEAYQAQKTAHQEHDLEQAIDYFTHEFPELGSRTRSSIEITATSLMSKFLTGTVRQLLSTDTTLVPEVLWENGAIVVLDFPIEDFGMEGRIMQGVIKYCFQKALLRRNLTEFTRPVFLAGDEYQHFLSSYDYQFLSIARSAGVAGVFATQNISNLYSILGAGARDQANSLLGNCATKIFHANTDVPTNEFASSVIGAEWMNMVSTSMKQGKVGTDNNISINKQVHPRLLASDFISLKTGGAHHRYIVEAFIIQTGRGAWHSTKNVYHKAAFRQEFGGS
jgi:hypothetical protein